MRFDVSLYVFRTVYFVDLYIPYRDLTKIWGVQNVYVVQFSVVGQPTAWRLVVPPCLPVLLSNSQILC